MGETQETLEPKDQRGQDGSIHQVPKLQIAKYQKPMDWLAFMEKKRTELSNTGHVMKLMRHSLLIC